MTNKMWGGRFAAGPDAIMEEINASIDFDQRLAAQDIAGSKAHAAMLAKQGIVSKADAAEMRRGLDLVLKENRAGRSRLLAGARRHPHECRVAAQGTDRRAGRAAPYRAVAQ